MNSFVIYTLRQRSKNNLTRSKCQGQTQGQCQGDKQYQRQIYVILLLVAFAFLVMTTPVYVTILWQSFYFRPTPKLITSYSALQTKSISQTMELISFSTSCQDKSFERI